jgi:hypothetical protein
MSSARLNGILPKGKKYCKTADQMLAQLQGKCRLRLTANQGSRKLTPDMGKLSETIHRLVAEGKYVVGEHASERLDERGIMEWQAAAGLQSAQLLSERPRTKPNPSIEVREELPDGTEFKAVWSLLRQSGVAKLVTVHFFD